jgi:group I intron endonuclease
MIIYKTTNLLTGQYYIGKDKHNNPKYLGSGKKLVNAIKKYGKENFSKTILEYCISDEHMASREQYWIEQLDSIRLGYNLAAGGNGGNTRKGYSDIEMQAYKTNLRTGYINSEKVAISIEARRGKKRPEHSELLKMLYKTGKIVPHNLGKQSSNITKQKISLGNRGKTRTNKHKQILAESKYKSIDVYTISGEYIETISSIKEASNKYNVGRDSIYGVCAGKYKTGAGYIWKYTDLQKDQENNAF